MLFCRDAAMMFVSFFLKPSYSALISTKQLLLVLYGRLSAVEYGPCLSWFRCLIGFFFIIRRQINMPASLPLGTSNPYEASRTDYYYWQYPLYLFRLQLQLLQEYQMVSLPHPLLCEHAFLHLRRIVAVLVQNSR
jgi:hypothetical protein